MRKVKWLASAVVAAGVFLSANVIADAKVVWDGAEITAGQTGKLSFNQDTKIYKKNADGTFTSMVAPKGSFYRVYGTIDSTVGKVHNMSGGYRVSATNLVTYKDVPVGVQDQLKMQAVDKVFFAEEVDSDEANIHYVEISGLTNDKLQRQMNTYLKSLAEVEARFYAEGKVERDQVEKEFPDYSGNPIYNYLGMGVDYNSNGYLSIGISSTTYYGGAHGHSSEHAVHYNLITGKHIDLKEFVQTPAQQKKLDNYVRQQMMKANGSDNEGGLYWVDDFVTIHRSQPFYIQDDGIELIFNQYDLGPYAVGIRYIFVPFKVLQ